MPDTKRRAPIHSEAKQREEIDNRKSKIVNRKRCPRCGEVKALDEFHRDSTHSDGRTSHCKACRKAGPPEWYRRYKKRNHGRILTRRRELDAIGLWKNRLRVLRYRKKNREKLRRLAKDYVRRNAERIKAYHRRYCAENQHKIKAHRAVRQALIYDDLQRQECEICTFLGLPSDRRKSIAHHEDYDRPLDVRWLCRPHHRQLHAGHFCLRRALGTGHQALGETAKATAGTAGFT